MKTPREYSEGYGTLPATEGTHRGQRIASTNIGFPNAPGRQQCIEVVVIAGHQVICGACKYLGVHNVNAVGIQGQRVM